MQKLKKYFPETIGLLTFFILALLLALTRVEIIWLVTALTAGLVIYLIAYFQIFLRRWEKASPKIKKTENLAESASAAPWFDRKLKPVIPLPPMGGWALSPDSAAYLFNLFLEKKPAKMIELGSGVSTLIAGYAMEQNGKGEIYSIDGEAGYLKQSKELTKLHNLTHRVNFIHAPLQNMKINNWNVLWYKQEAFNDIQEGEIDLLLVDGPPSPTSNYARYPALPVLEKYLSPNAMIVFDDASRIEELKILEEWEKLGWKKEILPIGGGTAILYKV